VHPHDLRVPRRKGAAVRKHPVQLAVRHLPHHPRGGPSPQMPDRPPRELPSRRVGRSRVEGVSHTSPRHSGRGDVWMDESQASSRSRPPREPAADAMNAPISIEKKV
jgi:hypothetical protein